MTTHLKSPSLAIVCPKSQSGIHVGYAKYIWRELVFLLAYRRGVTLKKYLGVRWRDTEKVPWRMLGMLA